MSGCLLVCPDELCSDELWLPTRVRGVAPIGYCLSPAPLVQRLLGVGVTYALPKLYQFFFSWAFVFCPEWCMGAPTAHKRWYLTEAMNRMFPLYVEIV